MHYLVPLNRCISLSTDLDIKYWTLYRCNSFLTFQLTFQVKMDPIKKLKITVEATAAENIGPLWRRKYYVIPPQGLRNITSSIEAHNNRNVNHHSVITIDDDVTLNCQKLWWRL